MEYLQGVQDTCSLECQQPVIDIEITPSALSRHHKGKQQHSLSYHRILPEATVVRAALTEEARSSLLRIFASPKSPVNGINQRIPFSSI